VSHKWTVLSQAWWHTAVIQLLWRQRQEGHKFEPSPGKVSKSLSQKQQTQKQANKKQNKRARDMAQVAECMHNTLGSIPSINKQTNK
jgi:uncharacterized protein (UPF0332 family)